MAESKKQTNEGLFSSLNKALNDKTASVSTKAVLQNPEMYSVLSKMVTTGNNEHYDAAGEIKDTIPDLEFLLGVAAEKSQDIEDNEAIMNLLPDLSQAAEIMISYIRSPNYLLKTELNYIVPPDIFPLTTGVKAMKVVKDFFQNQYALDEKVHGILYDMLVIKGARVFCTIPEAALDEIINGAGIKNEVNNAKNKNSTMPNNPWSGYSANLTRQSFNDLDYAVKNPNKSIKRGIVGVPTERLKKKFNSLPSSLTIQDKFGVSVGYGDTYDPNELEEDYSEIILPEEIEFDIHPDLIALLKGQEEINEDDKDSALPHKNKKVFENKNVDLDKGTWSIKFSKDEDRKTGIEISEDLSLLANAFERSKRLSEDVLDSLSLQSADSYIRREINDTGLTGVDGSDREIMDKVFKKVDDAFSFARKQNSRAVFVATNEQTFRANVGEPYQIDVPPEAVIPIFKSGFPSEHQHYIFLLDEEGQFVTHTKPAIFFRELVTANTINSSKSAASNLIQQGRQMFEGFDNRWNEARQIDMLSRMFDSRVIKDLVDRLRNGKFGKNLDVGSLEAVNQVLLQRSLKGQKTRMLMVPKELVTYCAFDFDVRGMGVSLLDQMKTLLSLRIQFMLAQVRAGITNSIPRTRSTIRVDERDIDPKKTIIMGNELIVKSQAPSALRLNDTNVLTIEEAIRQSGRQISIDSEHPAIPKIGHEVEHFNTNIPIPDQETSDMLKRLSHMGFKVPPELVDSSFDIEFARSLVQANFILNLTTHQKQARFNPFLTKMVRTYVQSSPRMKEVIRSEIEADLESVVETLNESLEDNIEVNKLSEVGKKKLIDYLTLKFIDKITCTLPVPNDDNVEMKNEALQAEEERIDNAIKYLLTEEAWSADLLGNDVVGSLTMYATVIKGDLMREWMIENNYMPKLMEYLAINEKGEQSYEKNRNIRDMAVKAVKAAMEMQNSSKAIEQSATAVMKVNDLIPDDGFSDSGSFDSGGSDSGSDDGGDEGESGGGDEFGMDMGGFDMDMDLGGSDQEQ